MLRRVEYVLSQNHPGRVGTISILGRLTGGLLLRIGCDPLQVNFATYQYRQGYARSVGQGPLVWQDLDPIGTSPAALVENIEKGFIVEHGAGLSVVERNYRIQFCIYPSVLSWVCSPEQEAERRRNAVDTVDDLTQQGLDLGVSYPIECKDSKGTYSTGVMILGSLVSDGFYTASIRAICDETFDSDSDELSLFRYERPVGTAWLL